MANLLILNFDTDFSDSSGNGNNPIDVTNFVIVSGVATSVPGYSYFQLSYSTYFEFGTSNFVFTANVKLTDINDFTVYQLSGVGGHIKAQLYYWNDSFYSFIESGINFPIYTSDVAINLSLNTNYLLTVKKTTTALEFYVDNVLVNSVQLPVEFSIGAVSNHWAMSGFFGEVDNIVIADTSIAAQLTIASFNLLTAFSETTSFSIFTGFNQSQSFNLITSFTETSQAEFNLLSVYAGVTKVSFNIMTTVNDVNKSTNGFTLFTDFVAESNAVVIDIHNPETPIAGSY